MTPREAKEYLVTQIVPEAKDEETPLDDVERRMLYFTETAWMPEDFEGVLRDFERSGHEDAVYEQRIMNLVANLKTSQRFDRAAWNAAMRALRGEDHYILILIDGGFGSYPAIFRQGSRAHRVLKWIFLITIATLLAILASLLTQK